MGVISRLWEAVQQAFQSSDLVIPSIFCKCFSPPSFLFFFSWKYCHWIFRLFLCRSYGLQFAPYSRGSSVCLWGFSHWLYLRGQHGEGGEGKRVGVHIQGCTLMITVVFLLKGLFWHTVFLSVFSFTAQTAIPIASTELWQIKLCLHQTCFCIHKTYLKHFLIV